MGNVVSQWKGTIIVDSPVLVFDTELEDQNC